jgi:outer membrane protein assembly factor BamB
MVEARRRRWLLPVAGIAVLAVLATVVGIVLLRKPGGDQADPVRSATAFPTGALTCASADAQCAGPGQLRWSLPLPDELPMGTSRLLAPACVRKVADTVYLAVAHKLHAVDAASGRLRWSAAVPALTDAPFSCFLTTDAEHVVLSNIGGGLTVLARPDGRVVSTLTMPYPDGDLGTSRAPVAFDGGAAVWLDPTGEVCAVDLLTGRRVWTTKVAAFTGYQRVDRTLFLDATGGDGPLTRLQRVDVRTGALSSMPLAEPVGPAARLRPDPGYRQDDTGGVLLLQTSNAIVAASATDGSVRWRIPTTAALHPRLVTVDGPARTMHLPSSQAGRYIAVDTGTGAEVGSGGNSWQAAEFGVALATLPGDQGHGVFANAFDARTQRRLWRVAAPPYAGEPITDGALPRVAALIGCATYGKRCTRPVLAGVSF